MLNYDHNKKYGLPMDESLKQMRIRRNPIQLEEGLICNDQLESKGIIQIMEYIGGPYIAADSLGMEQGVNAVMVVEITVSVAWEERKVHISSIRCEYGHDDLVPLLIGQVVNFADFYNCRVSISNPQMAGKPQLHAAIIREMAIAGSGS